MESLDVPINLHELHNHRFFLDNTIKLVHVNPITLFTMGGARAQCGPWQIFLFVVRASGISRKLNFQRILKTCQGFWI